MLCVDKIIHHAAFKRAGPIQGHQGDKVGKHFRFHLGQELAHAGAFKLENAKRVPFGEQIKGLDIVHGNLADIKGFAEVIFNKYSRPINNSKGLEPQKVELDKPGHLGVLHVVLGQGLTLWPFAERQVLDHGFR